MRVYSHFNPFSPLNHAQVILANIADVAECGAMLLEAKLPETFLVEVPVKLIPSEVRGALFCVLLSKLLPSLLAPLLFRTSNLSLTVLLVVNLPAQIELLLREFPDAAIGPNAPKPLDAEDSYKSQKGFDLKKAKA